MHTDERSPISRWVLLCAGVVIALCLAGALQKFRDQDAEREAQREEFTSDLNRDLEQRHKSLQATASVDLNPDTLNLGEMIRQLGSPSSSLPGASAKEIVNDLNHQAAAVIRARARQGGDKAFEVRWAGITAEFMVGDRPIDETDEPMSVSMQPQSYYGTDGLEKMAFLGSIRGIHLGDPVDRVIALGRPEGNANKPGAQPRRRGRVDWGKWEAAWISTNGKLDSLILYNGKLRYIPLS